MGIKFKCPCGKEFHIPEDRAGTQGRCFSCGRTFVVPKGAGPDELATGAGPRAQPCADAGGANDFEAVVEAILHPPVENIARPSVSSVADTQGGRMRGAAITGALVLGATAIMTWAFWPVAEKITGDKSPVSPASRAKPRPTPAASDAIRPETGRWAAKDQGEIGLSFVVIDRGFGRYIKSIIISGKGYRSGEFEAYGVVLTGRIEIEDGTFSAAGDDYSITGRFISPTWATGKASVEDPRTHVQFANTWMAKRAGTAK